MILKKSSLLLKKVFSRINKVKQRKTSYKLNFAEKNMDARLIAFERLLNVMDELREKCPWDQKQTMETLRNLTIEETYELADAITENDLNAIKGELGDLFLHLVFYSKIGKEEGAFDVADVLNAICEKLIYRHPHIYGDVKVKDEEEVKANWEKLKLKEGKKSVLEGVPSSLPALVKATRIQEKAKGIGFEWDNREDVWKKVEEELAEFKEEVNNKSEHIEEEFGDLLFSLVNYARFIDISPESALAFTNQKFIKRFQLMEEMITSDSKDIKELNLEEMDIYWDKAKLILKHV
jgi:XTP/dITP diphosphohydrolase